MFRTGGSGRVRLPALSLLGTSQGRGAGEPDQTMAGPFAESHNYGTTWPIVADGGRGLAWDSSWANWATNSELQFARHSLRKSILRRALEMVAGVRFELTNSLLTRLVQMLQSPDELHVAIKIGNDKSAGRK